MNKVYSAAKTGLEAELKELRESHINLKIIADSGIIAHPVEVADALEENNQLVAIFYKTLKTARGNK